MMVLDDIGYAGGYDGLWWDYLMVGLVLGYYMHSAGVGLSVWC